MTSFKYVIYINMHMVRVPYCSPSANKLLLRSWSKLIIVTTSIYCHLRYITLNCYPIIIYSQIDSRLPTINRFLNERCIQVYLSTYILATNPYVIFVSFIDSICRSMLFLLILEMNLRGRLSTIVYFWT